MRDFIKSIFLCLLITAACSPDYRASTAGHSKTGRATIRSIQTNLLAVSAAPSIETSASDDDTAGSPDACNSTHSRFAFDSHFISKYLDGIPPVHTGSILHVAPKQGPPRSISIS